MMPLQELLAELVSINSAFPARMPDPQRPGEQALGMFIESYLKKLGFAVQRQPVVEGRFNVLAEKGQGKHALLLSGHMDTVPAVKGWETDPWQLRAEGDMLYGLGACDMKGGLCAILQAVEHIQPRGYTLKLAFLVDEEHISQGAYTLIQSPWMQDVAAVLVPEMGTSGGQQLGPSVMTLGRQGRVDLEIQVRGRSSHAANAQAGVSALLRGAHVALALEQVPLAEHPHLGRARATIRSFVSQAQGLSIPEIAELRIDRHLVPPETAESARQDIEQLIEHLYQTGILSYDPALPITVRIPERPTPYLLPYVVARTAPFAQLVEQVIQQHLGAVSDHYAVSVADENYYGATLGLPVVVLGPLGGNNHAPDEWVSLSSLNELVMLYREILTRFEGYKETTALQQERKE